MMSPTAPPEKARHFCDHPQLFDLLGALEAIASMGGVPMPDGSPCRYRGSLDMGPVPDVINFVPAQGNKPAELTVSRGVLSGRYGPLPFVWRDDLCKAGKGGVPSSLQKLLDCFNHILIAQFLRILAQSLLSSSPALGGAQTQATFLICLAENWLGLELPAGLPREMLVRYFWQFHQRPSLFALKELLRDYFAVRIAGISYRPIWRQQPTTDSKATETSIFFDPLGCLRLHLGPMSRASYLAFLPEGSALRPLLQLTRLFISKEKEIEVLLELDEAERLETWIGPGPNTGLVGYRAWIPLASGAPPAGGFGFISRQTCARIEAELRHRK
jgi:predicted component of type VI protein secretion system